MKKIKVFIKNLKLILYLNKKYFKKTTKMTKFHSKDL